MKRTKGNPEPVTHEQYVEAMNSLTAYLRADAHTAKDHQQAKQWLSLIKRHQREEARRVRERTKELRRRLKNGTMTVDNLINEMEI